MYLRALNFHMDHSRNFKVNRSSAGSGKTYTLCLNFIALSLLGSYRYSSDYYRNILAITFTNKAASEMKERVLEYLQILSNGENKDMVFDWIQSNIKMDRQDIIVHAKNVQTNILHNYGDLKISTIDKFNYNIIRTFSSDLGLSHDFDLELDNDKIIKPVIANLIDKISISDDNLSKSLIEFTLNKIEDGKSFDIQSDLEEFASNLFNEDAIPFLDSNFISSDTCIQLRDDLLKRKTEVSKEIKDLSKTTDSYFKHHGFTKQHFLRGSFFNHFIKNLEDSKTWEPTESLIRNIRNDLWYSKSQPDEDKELVDNHKFQFIIFFNDLMDLLSEYNTINALSKNIYSISVLNQILLELNKFKTENNIEQISVFNKKIHEIIIEQPSNFIYERLGARFHHFLIDEFQDTSLLQWQNLLPLITDVLDHGSCFIVGDGKQSIYRWRGSKVQQFLHLPLIFDGDGLPEKIDWQRKLEHHYVLDENPNQNYRSHRNIIEFNNTFFSKLLEILPLRLQSIYKECTQNADFADDGGYVHVELCDDAGDGFKKNIIKKIYLEIEHLIKERNFNYSDIAILCNSRKSVSFISEGLSELDIPLISNQGLCIDSSKKVQELILFCRCLLDENDLISKSFLINNLYDRFPIEKSLNQLNLEISNGINLEELLKKFNINIHKSKLIRLPLYQLISELHQVLSIEEDTYTSFFLDLILSYASKYRGSLSSFLQWWETNKESESIIVPEGTNAVQIMTIHKSKGLAFNVVMVPFNWEGTRGFSEIWVDAQKHTLSRLKHSLIRTSSSLKNSDFSEQYLEEKELNLLDNLNKLYVSMTRSVQRLYIYSKVYPNKISESFLNSGRLNSFLYHFGLKDKFIKGNYNEDNQIKKNKSKKIFQLNNQHKVRWQNIVSLKRSSVREWDMDDISSKKDWGTLLHYTLSKLEGRFQIEDLCNQIYLEGLCSEKDKCRLILKLQDLLSHPKLEDFFHERWSVKTEQEILLPNGESYIPDRILFSEKKTIIIDYKTGVPEDSHKKQILNYANILKDMGYCDIEKFLVYTESKDILEKI